MTPSPPLFSRNVLLIANWLAEKGIPEKASWLRENFITGTAITVIIALLILLVSPGKSRIGIGQKLSGLRQTTTWKSPLLF